ncbi:hypothetical protein NQ315_012677 [Exocentrus adspersus]|uniref:Uncharacterized protein n=1 Tax=Exocentrus adspersus TaxID=1586481 RepID=A0AAV8VSW0_9CUCU|nr:hypothetical protein NQ315_012677 [Exocentrus adspersus]
MKNALVVLLFATLVIAQISAFSSKSCNVVTCRDSCISEGNTGGYCTGTTETTPSCHCYNNGAAEADEVNSNY